MNKANFEKELKETAVYALRYSSDFYGISGKGSFNKLLNIKSRDFINKCYEGFKLAQDKIITNILNIEDELKCESDILRKVQKGKKQRQIDTDPECRRCEAEISKLNLQKAAFQDLANSIVWTIFLQERTDIKSFVKTGGGSGYLKDRDIDTVIEVAKSLNKDPNKFTIICDITTSLHVGDLLTVGDGKFTVTEVKQSTPINNLISKIVDKALKEEGVDKDLMTDLHIKSPKHGLRQLKRYMDQIISFSHLKKYIETDKGYDQNFKMNKSATKLFTYDVGFDEMVDFVLDDIEESKKDHVFLPPFDCCMVAIFKESYGSEFVMSMGFKHYLYHELLVPAGECEYIKGNLGHANDELPEMFKYQKAFKIYDIREKMFSTVNPLFSTLKESHVIDILTGKISIYIYFDHDRFFEMCKEKGLRPEWVPAKDIDQRLKKQLPKFNDRYLQIGKGDNKFILGYGMLFQIIFDFKSGYNLIQQMKESLWIQSHPKLSRLREVLYTRKRHLFFLGRIYFKKFFKKDNK